MKAYEEIDQLAAKAKACVKARETLLEKLRPAIYKAISRSERATRVIEDAAQEGYAAVLEALFAWDETRGGGFFSYTRPYIRGAVGHAARTHTVGQPVETSWQRREASRFMDIENQLTAFYGRMPTVREIAFAAGVQPGTVVSVRGRTAPHVPLMEVPIEEPGDYGYLYEALDALDSRSYELLVSTYGLLEGAVTVEALAREWGWSDEQLALEIEDAHARLRAALGMTGPEALTTEEILTEVLAA